MLQLRQVALLPSWVGGLHATQPVAPKLLASPATVQEEGAAVELESPFNNYSLQEVCFLLRFVYRPSDLTDRNLKGVEQHLPGITRLANR